MIISQLIQSSVIHRFKAPKSTMFNILDIHWTVFIAGANRHIVVNYLVEDERTTLPIDGEGVISVMATDIAGQAEDFSFQRGEKSKFISIGRSGSTSSQSICIIHYELVPASKVELIWEWFRKGR